MLLCLAPEIDSALFAEDLEVQIPVCRVALDVDLVPFEAAEPIASGDVAAHISWRPALPSPESPPRRLVATLARRGLLLEPFERAVAGIEEALTGG